MSKRPIPILKKEDELESFIHMIEEAKDKKESKKEDIKKDPKEDIKDTKKEDRKIHKQEPINQIKEQIKEKTDNKPVIKKSLVLSEEIDNLLRIESAKTRKTQNEIIEEALKIYFEK